MYRIAKWLRRVGLFVFAENINILVAGDAGRSAFKRPEQLSLLPSTARRSRRRTTITLAPTRRETLRLPSNQIRRVWQETIRQIEAPQKQL